MAADDGSRQTLTLAEFEKQYGWKNDPEKALAPLRRGAKVERGETPAKEAAKRGLTLP